MKSSWNNGIDNQVIMALFVSSSNIFLPELASRS